MGKAEVTALVAVFGVCFILLVCLMVHLANRHGAKVRKGRKKTKEELLGYDPVQHALSGAAAVGAVGFFLCGLSVAMKSFRR